MYWVGQKVCSSFSATLYGKARMNFLDNPIKANKSPITTEKYLLKLLDTLILSDSYRKRNEVLVDLPNNLKTHSSILWGRNILKSGVCVCVYIHTYIRIYIYTHIHIYTYTYTHTHTLSILFCYQYTWSLFQAWCSHMQVGVPWVPLYRTIHAASLASAEFSDFN